ncbi:hypothetical protein LJK88_50235 [Paenibacillus sp. P26]|nr:hypothetical protein LJK88_50235 [Paenibacillus sp. P26]
MPLVDSNESKKKLCHLYNEVAKELFGVGTTLLKASIDQNIITFHAKHRRSARSTALEGKPLRSSTKSIFICPLFTRRRFGRSWSRRWDYRLKRYSGTTIRRPNGPSPM